MGPVEPVHADVRAGDIIFPLEQRSFISIFAMNIVHFSVRDNDLQPEGRHP
jgi:hypothetical protein